MTQEGYYRTTENTTVFVQCPAWLPHNACLANYTVGTCNDHYKGTLCAVCAQGRKGRNCDDCDAMSVSPGWQLIGFGAVYFLIFSWTTIRAFMQVPDVVCRCTGLGAGG